MIISKGTIFDVFAAVGGFVTFLLPVTSILRDIFTFTLQKLLLCDNDGNGGSIADIFWSCLESIGISSSGINTSGENEEETFGGK